MFSDPPFPLQPGSCPIVTGLSRFPLTPMDFSGIIPALISATIDGSIAGMNITDERKESVDYSDGYYESGSALVVNKEDDSMYFTMSQMY